MSKQDGINTYFLSLAIAGLLFWSGCRQKPQAAAADTGSSVKHCDGEDYGKVLVVHSYHSEYEWVRSINLGIQMEFGVAGIEKPRIEYFYMDTKLHPQTEWMEQKGQEALQLIGRWQPNAVITVDDNAQEYVGKELAKEGKVPCVFCGVNTNPHQYGYPAANVTGILERPRFKESIALLRKIMGKDGPLKLILLSDNSETSHYALDFMKTQTDSGVEIVECCTPDHFDQWKEIVASAPTRADAIGIYTYHTLRASDNTLDSIDARKVMEWTRQNASVPTVGFLVFAVNDGALCGVLESGVEQGLLASQQILSILKGTPVASLPIQVGSKSQSMLNMTTARHLGLSIPSEVKDNVTIVLGRSESR